ncbi:LysR family transcriptional regulator [Actimicrobium sp. CCC2.4]|uniref:LysR family transcriptional regulator n=1 Tax=Actimicrobium sp. CCC2.4 TaxID=3048606 RepID=UPI002AC9C3ED|nr:LysR family transcriptional regulator [Actimicrobium sp. CCC2.4]MEB0135921.1 LysR family transcriptional regulator [Actimicrobium sp. CCC2.4]WPX34065.1 LysR family transcriptional regulator [Actimicrobium sp. CCC2.4]
MDFTQLRAFVTIAQEGNLTRAAQHLHLTQPAVSLQLKALQKTLGVTLFTRSPGGMQLTVDGEKLLPFAERVLTGIAEFHQGVRALQSSISGPLAIGTILDPEFTRLGAFLKKLVENHPQLSTQLRQGMSGNVLQQVRTGILDAGYYLGIPPKEFHSQILTSFTYNVVAPQGWKARVAGKDWDALATLPWIWAPPESAHHRLLIKKFAEYKVLPEQVALVDQESSMLDLVKSGVGLSLVRESIALHEAHVHDLVIADTVSLSTELTFIALQSRKTEPAIASAFDLLANLWRK